MKFPTSVSVNVFFLCLQENVCYGGSLEMSAAGENVPSDVCLVKT